MENLNDINTVNDLLNIQKVVEGEGSGDSDFDRGAELLEEVRKLRPQIWKKMIRALAIDVKDFHNQVAHYMLTENRDIEKASYWVYDSGKCDAIVTLIDDIKL